MLRETFFTVEELLEKTDMEHPEFEPLADSEEGKGVESVVPSETM
jgi:hypothetical protein